MSNVVKFSKETIETFKKLNQIDQTLKIEADNEILRTKSHNNTMMARMTIKETLPRDFHIYDLRELISVINIVDDAELDFSSDKYVIIKSADGKQKLRYIEGSPDLITSFIDKDITLTGEHIKVEITPDQFDSVLTAQQTMKLDYIGIEGNNETTKIVAFNKNDSGDEEETNNFSIDVDDFSFPDGDEPDNFRMFYKIGVHKIEVLNGEGNLTFTIDTKKKISRVDTETGKVFFIALDSKSTFE